MKWNKESIRKFRQDLGITQTKFAELLGVTRRYVVYLESGVYSPSLQLQRLLDCLSEKYLRKGGEK